MSNIRKTIGENLRFYRKKAGFTQEKLSVLAKVDSYYISRLELGKENVSVETLVKLCQPLKIKSYLLLMEEPHSASEK